MPPGNRSDASPQRRASSVLPRRVIHALNSRRRSPAPVRLNRMPSLSLVSALHYTARRFLAVALCLLLVAAPACARAQGKDYFPLAVGARWEYAGRFNAPDGRRFDVPAVIRVEGETIIRGRRYLKSVVEADFSAVAGYERRMRDVRYYRRAADGFYYLRGQDTGGEERLDLPLPIPIGVAWLSGPAEARAERAGTIKAGGREYRDCLKVTYRGPTNEGRGVYHLAPGVGHVKIVFEEIVGPGSSLELELIRYER